MSDDAKSSDGGKATLQTVFINGNKISTLIPNRIFVGGFPQNTTEEELKCFFGKYGEIKDVKIIPDKAGQAKGSYGFVTFESQEVAEKIITEQAETLVFRDRKLNIGRAVKKQPLTGKSEMQNTLILNTLPLQFGAAVYPYQDYSYLFNQDLNTLYQNYSNQMSQISLLPTYASSLLAPFIAGNETLGLSVNPYQQLQSLVPISLTTPTQSTSPFGIDASAFITEQFSTTPTVSVEGSGSTTTTTDAVTISGDYFSYDVGNSNQSRSLGKTPLKPITNQLIGNSDACINQDDDYELPKKKLKQEETNNVTKYSEPIHYLFSK